MFPVDPSIPYTTHSSRHQHQQMAGLPKRGSVLFVSLGSFLSVSSDQITEMAMGIQMSGSAKIARMKQAKEEAEKEIAEYRAHMEAEFQKKVTESSGDSGANVKRLEVETDEKINHLKSELATISNNVVDMLLKHVTTVKN